MELKVKRIYNGDTYTSGELYIDGQYFCDTLEDKDRGLLQSMSNDEISSIKVYKETAIPKGTYKITLDVVSPKFSTYPFYAEVCQGKLPRLLDVPCYEGVLIHVADGWKKDKLLMGCIGIGDKQLDGSLINGKDTFRKLWDRIKGHNNIIINIE